MPLPSPSRQVQRVRHELSRRELVVLRVESPSPHFRRIVFGGEQMAGFITASFDDHVKLLFDSADDGAFLGRDYTPRHHDPRTGELTIEFVLHGDGPAAAWAAQAAPGQRLRVGGPRGSFIVPTDFDWHLMIGDATALPAVARRLEELPAGTQALVLLQVHAEDRLPLPCRAALDLRWLDDEAALLAAVQALALPAGAGYAWCAGEANAMAQIRHMLVQQKGHDRHAIRAAAYWKRGAQAHHEAIEG